MLALGNAVSTAWSTNRTPFALGSEDLRQLRGHRDSVRHRVDGADVGQHLAKQRHQRARIALDLVGTSEDRQHCPAADVGHLGIDAADIPANRGHVIQSTARRASAASGRRASPAKTDDDSGNRLDVLLRVVWKFTMQARST